MNLKPQNGQDNLSLSNGGLSVMVLNKALREVYDLFESLNLKPLLLGETAKSVKNKYVTGDKIIVGIKALELTRNARSIIMTRLRKYFERGISKTMLFEPDESNLISYDFAGVPIEIKVIQRKYSFFKHPDQIMYNFDEFLLPNPIERYLRAQYIVK